MSEVQGRVCRAIQPGLDWQSYPTEQQLKEIEEYDCFGLGYDKVPDLIAAAWSPYGKLTYRLGELRLITGGWSSNEDVIRAMKANGSIRCKWILSSLGGLHIYELDDSYDEWVIYEVQRFTLDEVDGKNEFYTVKDIVRNTPGFGVEGGL